MMDSPNRGIHRGAAACRGDAPLQFLGKVLVVWREQQHLQWPRLDLELGRAGEDIPQERTALVRAHAQVTVQEPHEVHACALLWQTMIYGLELLAVHHISYMI